MDVSMRDLSPLNREMLSTANKSWAETSAVPTARNNSAQKQYTERAKFGGIGWGVTNPTMKQKYQVHSLLE
jgi:hypothetical protein